MNIIKINSGAETEPTSIIDLPDPYEAWLAMEMQEAIKEADADIFATDEEVRTTKDKWKIHAN